VITKRAAPGEMLGGDPRGGKVSNGNERSIARESGPRHVGEILDRIIWKLMVARESERAKVQP
jgi:hypothetical protein